ncbi:MAG: hypothetical protein RLZZ241_1157 [Bacteroidota bacterium]
MANNRQLLSVFSGIAVLVIFFIFSSCAQTQSQSMEQEQVTFTKEGTLEVRNLEKDSVLAQFNIEFAETDYEIQTGLMYREKLGNSEGMLFLFKTEAPHAFYMKNTLIALDLLFIRSDSSIAHIARNAKPLDESSIPSGAPVQFVLEINAGLSTQLGIKEGHKVSWQR